MRSFCLILVSFCLFVFSAHAQEPARFGDYEAVGTSYHKFVLPGESSITVLVLGDGGASGMYEIGRQTDLGQLIALSSAALGTVTPQERREVKLKLYRQSGGQRDIVYEAQLEDFLSYPGQYPGLQDRDVLVIQTIVKQRFRWRDALSIVTGVAAVALAVDRFRRVTR